MELHIRRFEENDLLSLFELLSDEEVMRYIEPPYTLEQTEAFLKKAGLSDPPLIYAAEDEEGNFAGYVIWHDYEEGCKEIGWILKRAYWGKGCAQALTKQLITRTGSEGKSAVI
ncbi:MAG: GNAT family N-acetyltransferase, partial [Parasporobacterium sp.]|nr:GNAT family N-acetyltransferase [Parasporobacterium sp.]